MHLVSIGSVHTFLLFSRWDIGNLMVKFPVHPVLEEAVGSLARLVYLQLYTPMIKAMEERVPLIAKPHLLTYMLGEDYVKNSPKFKKVWDEVNSGRTRKELIELSRIGEPFEARLKVVVTGRDFSFLPHFVQHFHSYQMRAIYLLYIIILGKKI